MPNRAVYLDNAATRPIRAEVLEEYYQNLKEIYANPASSHKAGRLAFDLISSARKLLADLFQVKPEQLIFTSGGTEAINLALKGIKAAYPKLPQRILLSEGEHKAVFKAAAALDWEMGLIKIEGKSGAVSSADLLASLQKKDTGLVSLILVSNETGAITEAAELIPLIKKLSPRTKIHLDAVQAVGKIKLDFRDLGSDLISISGHKIGAPKGVGLLIKQEKLLLSPLLHGGGQQQGLRSGTENAPLAMAMARAVKISVENLAENNKKCQQLKEIFLHSLSEVANNFRLISPEKAVPQIISLSFPDLRGETLVNAASERGVYLSHGSACSGIKGEENLSLRSLGLSEREILGTLRISLSEDLSPEEVSRAAKIIASEYLKWRL